MDDITNFMKEIRGYFLNTMIIVERQIDIYISEYFSKDFIKREEMMLSILSRINLKSKREIFERMIKKNEPLFYEKYTTEINGLNNLIDRRNVLAHAAVDYSETAMLNFVQKKFVTLKRLNDEIIPETYNEKTANQLIHRAAKLTLIFNELIGNGLPSDDSNK